MVSITSGVESWAQDVQSENARSSRVSKVELGYDPFPKQQEFHASLAEYRLFGGAAGPGKSKALLMEAILQAHDHPNTTTPSTGISAAGLITTTSPTRTSSIGSSATSPARLTSARL